MLRSYSVDQLKTWSRCQKKYELTTVRKLGWPSNPSNFKLGKGVHQLLDYAGRGLPLEPILADADEKIVLLWKLIQQSRWAQLPIIASEWGFSLEVGGRWIYGRIDRVVQDDEMVRILDWKTGTSIPAGAADDWQTRIYLYAVMQTQRELGLSIAPEQLAFTYVQAKRGGLQEVTVPYSQIMHEETEARLLETMSRIEAAVQYRLPPACPDDFCPYRNVCGILERQAPDDRIPGAEPMEAAL